MSTKRSHLELLDEVSNWGVGGGIVTMALFPLALPGLVLVLAAAIPLLAVGLVVAVVGGLILLPVQLVRRAFQARRRPARPSSTPAPQPPRGGPELSSRTMTAAGHP